MKHSTKHSVLGLALAGATLFAAAGPAAAQSPGVPAPANNGVGYGYTPPTGTPVTPDNMGGTGAIPPVGRQIQAARSVQGNDPTREAGSLLRRADQALKQRKVAVANELLERAQTTVLNQPGNDGSNTGSDLGSKIGDARKAVVAGNMSEAHGRIADALGAIGGGDQSTAGAAPARRRNR